MLLVDLVKNEKRRVIVRSVNILIKPSSSHCNLRCSYCFYFDETSHRDVTSYGYMSSETMDAIIDKALNCATERCEFGFQGGEPMLSGLKWYQRFVERVRESNIHNIDVQYSIQTNGILITEEWAQFFSKHGFLVGVSLDGPSKYHNRYRVDKHGDGSFRYVMNGIDILKKYNVDFNILTVVTARTARNIKEIYKFFMEKNLPNQQYIPCLDPLSTSDQARNNALSVPMYARFLKDLFDVWYEDRRAGVMVYNRYFENLAGLILGLVPESCNMRGTCSIQYAIEADGSVFPCDFYMLDTYLLGNINKNSLQEIDLVRTSHRFIERSSILAEKCHQCRWFALCRGGCYRERVIAEPNKVPLNRYCEAYQEFFAYAVPRLQLLLK